MRQRIQIEDQGLRDGLQNLIKTVPTTLKLQLISILEEAGLKRIEIASFVHPRMVPTMADAEKICSSIVKKAGITYAALALNFRGLQRAESCGMTDVTTILYGTETFAKKNSGKGIAANKQIVKDMLLHSRTSGTRIRGGISVSFGCRYEGQVQPERILDLAKFLLDEGVQELYLADTTGMGNPESVFSLSSAVQEISENIPLGLHLHDTESKGYANLVAGLNAGVSIFDTSFGGLGGCPFVSGASGNIATEDSVNLLHQMGYDTGINIGIVSKASRLMADFLNEKLPGKLYSLIDNPEIEFI